MQESEGQKDWWKTLFGQNYLDIYLPDFTPERTSQEVDFVIKVAKLTRQDKILDLACGHGRHSIELAKRGLTVVGLDYSVPFIEKAKADAKKAGVKVDFTLGDMKDLPFNQDFDVVLLLFTSFGFFHNKENQEVFNQINKSLKPNGRFLLDVISGEAVERRFSKEGQEEEGSDLLKISRTTQMNGIAVDEIELYDSQEQLVHNRREWLDDGAKKEFEYHLRVYTVPQYKDMLAEAGLEFQDLWGDFSGNPHNTNDNVRTILLAKKVER